jgi:hypothetical protein
VASAGTAHRGWVGGLRMSVRAGGGGRVRSRVRRWRPASRRPLRRPATGGPRGTRRSPCAPVASPDPSSARCAAEVGAGDWQLRLKLAGELGSRGLDDVETVEPPGPQCVDDGVIEPRSGRPVPGQPAMPVVPHRPREGPVGPQEGALAEPEKFPGPLARRVDRQPRGLAWGHVESEHDRPDLDRVREAEEVAAHPELLHRPADLRAPEPQLLGGHLSRPHEVPDRRRALHVGNLCGPCSQGRPGRREEVPDKASSDTSR